MSKVKTGTKTNRITNGKEVSSSDLLGKEIDIRIARQLTNYKDNLLKRIGIQILTLYEEDKFKEDFSAYDNGREEGLGEALQKVVDCMTDKSYFAPGSAPASRPDCPLRNEQASFPAHSSSLNKALFYQDPAVKLLKRQERIIIHLKG